MKRRRWMRADEASHAAGARWGAWAVLGVLVWCGALGSAQAQDAWEATHAGPDGLGRAAGVGAIDVPAVVWERFIGGRLGDRGVYGLARDGGGVDALAMLGSAASRRCLGCEGQAVLWDTPPLAASSIELVADLDGDGLAEIVALGSDVQVLDPVRGDVVWTNPAPESMRNSTVTALQIDDDPEPELLFTNANVAESWLYDFSGDRTSPRLVWSLNGDAEPRLPVTRFHVVEGEFDGDLSTRELATVIRDCGVLVLDRDTGAVIREVGPLFGDDVGFCYGLTQSQDVNGDGVDELIVTGGRGSSGGIVGAVAFDFVQDAALWQRVYGVGDAVKRLTTPARGVVDMDGDGAYELLMSVYDNTLDSANGADRWSMEVVDAATGEVLGLAYDLVVVGTADLNGDGAPEMLTQTTTPGRVQIDLFGQHRAWILNDSRDLVGRWQIDDAQLVYQPQRDFVQARTLDNALEPALVDTGDAGQRGLMVVRQSDADAYTLQLLTFSDDSPLPQPSAERALTERLSFTVVSVEASANAGAVLVKDSLGRVQALDAQLNPLASAPFPGYDATILAFDAPNGVTQFAYNDSAGNLTLDTKPAGDPDVPPEARWKRASRSSGLVIALDVEGDGVRELVRAAVDIDGVAFVELVNNDGEQRWVQPLPDFQGAPTSLVSGQFGGNGAPDVALLGVTLEGDRLVYALDGALGGTLGVRTVDLDEAGRFPGREVLALPDNDGDGLDELLVLHWETMEVLDTPSLELVGAYRRFPMGFSRPTASALFQADADAEPEVFLNFFFGGRGVMDPFTGETVWTAPVDEHILSTPSKHHGFSDVNGDGVLDIALPGTRGDVTVFDGASGVVLYRRCLKDGASTPLLAAATPETCQDNGLLSPIATGDIDGDGFEEWVVGSSFGWLYAINAVSGELKWSLRLRYRVRHPILADMDNDGALEVALTTANSRLLLIDQAEVDAPAELREVALRLDNSPLLPERDIDFWARTDALGLAWTPVEDADGYRVALLTENGEFAVDWTDVGDVTTWVFEGLSLLSGQRYSASIIAYRDGLGPSQTRDSDGVLVLETALGLFDLRAFPDAFVPAREESTELSGNVVGPDPVVGITLTAFSPDNAQVWSTRVVPDVPDLNALEFTATWDGRDVVTGDPLPEGTYTVEAIAEDLNGQLASARVAVVLVDPPPQPDAGVEDAEQDATGDASDDVVTEDATGGEDVNPDTPDPVDSGGEGDAQQGAEVGVVVDDTAYQDDSCCGGCSVGIGGQSGSWPGLVMVGLLGLVGLVRRRLR